MKKRSTAPLHIDLPDEAASIALARELALFARPGGCLCLSGDLGTGKTTIARALIRALMPPGAAELEVPSPTFALVQPYDRTRIPVQHFDLYRIADATEAIETGFDDLDASGLAIVEWPERAPGLLPPDRIELRLEHRGDGRVATLAGHGTDEPVPQRLAGARAFLARAGAAAARRSFLEGDASSRRYERLVLDDGSRALLMDMPARPDGPPLRDGKPYSRLAGLAEDIRAVVAVNRHLSEAGFSAPEIIAADLRDGFAIIEDLGDAVFGDMARTNRDMDEPMQAATSVLAEIAGREWPAEVDLPDGATYRVRPYDATALEIELSLLADWYWPHVAGTAMPASVRAEFEAAWRSVIPLVANPPRPVWVLRDYHSPNLIWLPDREPVIRKVGLIDTQDCLLGHPAYDLASLLQDARIDVVGDTERDLFDYYCAWREAEETGFDRAAFTAAYAILGAQRATKVLGIFARLARRDSKPGYLAHLPRVSRALERNLAHEALAPVRGWHVAHMPLSEPGP